MIKLNEKNSSKKVRKVANFLDGLVTFLFIAPILVLGLCAIFYYLIFSSPAH